MEFACTGTVVEWRGPAPYVFVELPQETTEDIKEAARGVEYWGQVAVSARIREVGFTTALFPKDGRYLLPLRKTVRGDLGLEVGEQVVVELDLAPRRVDPS